MPATWPATLPQKLLVQGNRQGIGDGRLRSQPDAGPPLVRPRFRAVASPLSGSIRVTTDQIAILEAFIEDDLAGGSLPFTFPDPREGDDLLVRFAGSLPSWSNIDADSWDISLDLEVLR